MDDDVEREARKAGWRGKARLPLLSRRLPRALRSRDWESSDPKFVEVDAVVERLRAKGKLRESWDLVDLQEALDHCGPALGFHFTIAVTDHLCAGKVALEPIACVREFVTIAGEGAIQIANTVLVENPTMQAHRVKIRKRLQRLIKELCECEQYTAEDLLEYEGEISVAETDQILAAEDARFKIAMSAAAIARDRISALEAAIRSSPPSTGQDDILAQKFISFMRVLWRLIASRDPGRSASGPFVRFVVAGWRMNGFAPLRVRPRSRRRRNTAEDVNALTTWLGRRILNQAREEDWSFSRRRKKTS